MPCDARRIVVKSLRSAAVALLLLISLVASATAQGVSGTVSGTVKDAQGGVIPGASVTLVSEARGTRMTPVVTNGTGDFVVPNVAADTYTVQIDMPLFKTLKRAGVSVSPGSRVVLGTLTIQVGGGAEEVIVKGEAPMIQAASGEKSFTISTESVSSLPLGNRSYDALLGLMPGVATNPGGLTPASRLGGGGDSNFMLDGATAMDPGVNRPATRVSVEAIQEVKVATSTYQAEYGRSSGLQVNAVTKSGTNQFRGAMYDVERHSKWNSNSKTSILNGDPKELQDERDWGFAIGGPIGRPGKQNKLFFYYNQEFQPRVVGGDTTRYRLPTVLERQGDFSQSTDNLGAPYSLIRNPAVSGTCTSANTAANPGACFVDAGVLGRIPKAAQYAPGMAILNWYPLPNIPNVPAGQAYNFETTYPALNLLGYQPVIRLDYQPTPNLRGSFKFLEYQQPSKVHPGILAGWNDSREDDYGIWASSATVNWTMNQSTFWEFSWGKNYHHQEGCSVSGAGPNFCRNALQTNAIANRVTAGFGDIPYLFPDATKLDPRTFSYEVIARSGSPIWDGTRVQVPQSFSWGSRVTNSPPNNIGPFGNFILDTNSGNTNLGVTKIMGHHTAKAGYYYFKSLQRRGQGTFYGAINFGNDSNNPLDTTFGFANAAVGVFSTYQQQSRWGEGAYTAINHEAFIQDNWKVTRSLTLDYGIRFVHQVPQYDGYQQASNFLPDTWKSANAPVLYIPGCVTGTTCTGTTNRQAMNPKTGQLLGVNTSLAIGTLVPNTGSSTNGIAIPGKDIANTNGLYPTLALAPRVGAAWDPSGKQRFVVRGGGGLFFDRPQAQNVYNTVNNPPFTRNVTVRYGQLQSLGSAGLTTEAPPSLTVWQYDMPLPSSAQWNGGVQMSLPYATSLDVSYTGQHSFHTPTGVNINNIDLGLAFQPQYADPTQATPTVANSLVATLPDLIRFYRGYSTISQQQTIGWRTYHSIQMAVNRRFQNGLSFGFNDTWQLSDKQLVAPRLLHNADGTITLRADNAKAQELFGDNRPQSHVMRANFVWDLPDLKHAGAAGRAAGLVINDWSLSGIWSGQAGSSYAAGFSYVTGGGNVNLTGSPDYAARLIVTGDPGSGCSADRLKQFNTSAFKGPAIGSDGLESSNSYLVGCFQSSLDLAINRTIRLSHGRSLQLRADVFNVFNQAAITNRSSSMQLSSPADPLTIQNLPFNPDGTVNTARSLPRGAGFGVATQYQSPRTVQGQIRFSF